MWREPWKRDHCTESTILGPAEDGRSGKRKPSRRLTALIPQLPGRGRSSLSKRHSHLLVGQLGSFKEIPNILSEIRTASWALMVALWRLDLGRCLIQNDWGESIKWYLSVMQREGKSTNLCNNAHLMPAEIQVCKYI